MIENPATAKALQVALADLEHKRKNLIDAPEEELVDRANEYEQARRDATPCFAAAAAKFDGEVAEQPGQATPPTPPTPATGEEQPAETPAEASPGVPLIKPPGVEVTAETLETYGPLRKYRSKVDPAIEIEATPYAFDEGTAIKTGMAEGTVATAQPSRIIRNGEELGIQANDVFNQHYDVVETEDEKGQSQVPEGQVPPVADSPPAQAGAPEGGTPAAETPAAGEGADEAQQEPPPADPAS